METVDYESAKVLQKDIAEIVALQARNAVTGVKASITIITSANTVAATREEIIAALGQGPYDTICATALASINTQLASIKTTKDTAFAALGA